MKKYNADSVMGKDTLSNIIVAHAKCHVAKGHCPKLGMFSGRCSPLHQNYLPQLNNSRHNGPPPHDGVKFSSSLSRVACDGVT
ncbi:hypothetical protein TanjilG_15896 [Lupinus angustifolius]|uniref:Uncharacterized protein n=1 Tax=Lupinus angustifolius TaxID=3871 RepID=A0A4P1RGU0_LUPAN|nr:hypothetical protein TanjilG_15896 [Lupinus angustifolius]